MADSPTSKSPGSWPRKWTSQTSSSSSRRTTSGPARAAVIPRVERRKRKARGHPPSAKRAHAQNAVARERRAVVRPQGPGQAMGREDLFEAHPDVLGSGGLQHMAAQQHPAVVVGHGQRVAVAAVAQPEMSPEAQRPDVVGTAGVVQRRRRSRGPATHPPGNDHSRPLQDLSHRTGRGPGQAGLPAGQPRPDLPEPSSRVLPAYLQHPLLDGLGRLVRNPVRRLGAVPQPLRTQQVVPIQPTMQRLPTHPALPGGFRNAAPALPHQSHELHPCVQVASNPPWRLRAPRSIRCLQVSPICPG